MKSKKKILKKKNQQKKKEWIGEIKGGEQVGGGGVNCVMTKSSPPARFGGNSEFACSQGKWVQGNANTRKRVVKPTEFAIIIKTVTGAICAANVCCTWAVFPTRAFPPSDKRQISLFVWHVGCKTIHLCSARFFFGCFFFQDVRVEFAVHSAGRTSHPHASFFCRASVAKTATMECTDAHAGGGRRSSAGYWQPSFDADEILPIAACWMNPVAAAVLGVAIRCFPRLKSTKVETTDLESRPPKASEQRGQFLFFFWFNPLHSLPWWTVLYFWSATLQILNNGSYQ